MSSTIYLNAYATRAMPLQKPNVLCCCKCSRAPHKIYSNMLYNYYRGCSSPTCCCLLHHWSAERGAAPWKTHTQLLACSNKCVIDVVIHVPSRLLHMHTHSSRHWRHLMPHRPLVKHSQLGTVPCTLCHSCMTACIHVRQSIQKQAKN